MTKPFFKHLHAFRGLAIIGVVCSHALGIQVVINGGPAAAHDSLVLNSIQEMFFHGSTLFFALISGLLFSLVLRSRGWLTFYQSKVFNVVFPYIFVSTLLTLIIWHGPSHSFMFIDAGLIDTIKTWIKNILLGRAMYHLWYIPVLLFLFVITPVLSWLVFQCKQRWLLVLVILLPLISSRTWPDHSVFNLIYFTGAYTFGIWLGSNYEQFMEWISRFKTLLIIFTLFTSLIIFALKYFHIGHFGFFSPSEMLWYIQKLVLSCLLLLWFRSIESKLPKVLFLFAEYAFTLFFLHAIFMLVSSGIQITTGLNQATLLNMLSYAAITGLLSAAFSLLIGIGLKKLLGKRSRLLLGS